MKKIINVLLCLILIISVVPPSVLCQENQPIKLNGIPSEKILYKDPNGRFLIVTLSDQERENLLSLIKSKLDSYEWVKKGPEVNLNENVLAIQPAMNGDNNVTPNPVDLSNLVILDNSNLPEKINGVASVMFLNIGPIGFCLNSKNDTLCNVGFGIDSKVFKNESLEEKLIGDSNFLRELIKNGFSKVESERTIITQPSMGEATTFYIREGFYNFIKGVIDSGYNQFLDSAYVVFNVVGIGSGVADVAKAAKGCITNPTKCFDKIKDFKKTLSETTKVKNSIRKVLDTAKYNIDDFKKFLKEAYKDGKVLDKLKVEKADLTPLIKEVEKLLGQGKKEDAGKLAAEYSKFILDYADGAKITTYKIDANNLKKIYNAIVAIEPKVNDMKIADRKSLSSTLSEIKDLIDKYKNGEIPPDKFISDFNTEKETILKVKDELLNGVDSNDANIKILENALNLLSTDRYIKGIETKDLVKTKYGDVFRKVQELAKNGKEKDAADLYIDTINELQGKIKGGSVVKGVFALDKDGRTFQLGKIFDKDDVYIGFFKEGELEKLGLIGSGDTKLSGFAIYQPGDEKKAILFTLTDSKGDVVALDKVDIPKNELEKLITDAKNEIDNLLNKYPDLERLYDNIKNFVKNFQSNIPNKLSNSQLYRNLPEIKISDVSLNGQKIRFGTSLKSDDLKKIVEDTLKSRVDALESEIEKGIEKGKNLDEILIEFNEKTRDQIYNNIVNNIVGKIKSSKEYEKLVKNDKDALNFLNKVKNVDSKDVKKVNDLLTEAEKLKSNGILDVETYNKVKDYLEGKNSFSPLSQKIVDIEANLEKIDKTIEESVKKSVENILEYTIPSPSGVISRSMIEDIINNVYTKRDIQNLYDDIKKFKVESEKFIDDLKSSDLLKDSENKIYGKSIGKLNNYDIHLSILDKTDVDEGKALELYRELKGKQEMLDNLKVKDGVEGVRYGTPVFKNAEFLVKGFLEKEYLKGISRALKQYIGEKVPYYKNAKELFKDFEKSHPWLARILKFFTPENLAKGFVVSIRPGLFISSLLLLSNDIFGGYAGVFRIYGFSIDLNKSGNYSEYFAAITPTTYLNDLGYYSGDAIKSFIEFITGERFGINGIVEGAVDLVYTAFTPSVHTEFEQVKEQYKKAYYDLKKVLSDPYNLIVIHDAVSGTVKDQNKGIKVILEKQNADTALFTYKNMLKQGIFTYITKNNSVELTIFEQPSAVINTNKASISLFTRNIKPLVLYDNSGIFKNIDPRYIRSYTDFVIRANDELYRQIPLMVIGGTFLTGIAKPIASKMFTPSFATSFTQIMTKAALLYLIFPVFYASSKAAIKNSIIFNDEKFLKDAGFSEYVGKDCKKVLEEDKICVADKCVSWYSIIKTFKVIAGGVSNLGVGAALETGGTSLVLTVIATIAEWKLGEMEQEHLKKMYIAMLTCDEKNHLFIINKDLTSEFANAKEQIVGFTKWLDEQVNGKNLSEKTIDNPGDLEEFVNKYINKTTYIGKLTYMKTFKTVEDYITKVLPTTNVIVKPQSKETYRFKYVYMIYMFNSTAYQELKDFTMKFGDNTSVRYNKDKIIKDGKTIADIIPINYFDQINLALAITNKIVLINKNKRNYIFEIDKYGNLNITLNELKEKVESKILLGTKKKYHVDSIITKNFIIQYYNGRLVAEPITDIKNISGKVGIPKGSEIYVDSIKINSDGTIDINYNGNVYSDILENVFFDNNDGVISNNIYENYLVFATRYIAEFNAKDISKIEATKEINNKPVIDINTNNKTLNKILDNLTIKGIDAIATNDTMITFNKDGTVNITNLTNGYSEQYKNIKVVAGGKLLEKDGKYYMLKVYKDPETGLITTALVPLKSNNEKNAEKEAESLTEQDIKNRAIFSQPMLYMWTPNGMMYQNPSTGEIKVMNDFAFPINPNFNLYGATINGNGVYPSPNPLGLTPGVDLNKNVKTRPPLNVPSIPEGIPGLLFIICLFITITLLQGRKECNVQNVKEKQ